MMTADGAHSIYSSKEAKRTFLTHDGVRTSGAGWDKPL
jgi:hypothetical protein